MKLYTLIENQFKLEKAEVEIELIPGIPQIHFLGLPDKAIKESFFRIKSALKHCGYKFPTTQQVIVNIKPSHLKKSSKGLELAVAIGILIKTNQKEISEDIQNSIIYGELDLDGVINEPKDLAGYAKNFPEENILTGHKNQNSNVKYRLEKMDFEIDQIMDQNQHKQFIRPQLSADKKFSVQEAELLFLMSVTKFHTLLAGASGFGKSTLAKNYECFTSMPTDPESVFITEVWRPVIAPHHSVTPAAFLGGGAQLYQGEIEKANRGILILDELLEFNSQIIETLRGPMTGDKLRLSRAGVVREFDCQFQVVATTNLCPCGKWIPKVIPNCRYGKQKCEGYLNKLSGPIIDRFGLLMFYSNQKPVREISAEVILNRIENFQNLELKQKQSKTDLKASIHQGIIDRLYPDVTLRKIQSTLRVAEIFALERMSGKIEISDLNRAEKWTLTGFLQLERGMS